MTHNRKFYDMRGLFCDVDIRGLVLQHESTRGNVETGSEHGSRFSASHGITASHVHCLIQCMGMVGWKHTLQALAYKSPQDKLSMRIARRREPLWWPLILTVPQRGFMQQT